MALFNRPTRGALRGWRWDLIQRGAWRCRSQDQTEEPSWELPLWAGSSLLPATSEGISKIVSPGEAASKTAQLSRSISDFVEKKKEGGEIFVFKAMQGIISNHKHPIYF